MPVQSVTDEKFIAFCWEHPDPNFERTAEIEVRSDSDRLGPLQKKMREYLDNGAQPGWLIDTENLSGEIYRPGGKTEVRTGINSIPGEGPVASFVLDLTRIWDPLAN